MLDPTPTIVDPELTSRLGQIVIRWASLEGWISMMLATFVKADLGGMMVVTVNTSVSTQTNWIRALLSLHIHKQPDLARVCALLNRADDLRIERNELVHGLWEITNCEAGTALVHTVSLTRQEVVKVRLVTRTDLDELLVETNDWIADYVELGKALGFPKRQGGTKSIFLE